jgi:hypothetical protein
MSVAMETFYKTAVGEKKKTDSREDVFKAILGNKNWI